MLISRVLAITDRKSVFIAVSPFRLEAIVPGMRTFSCTCPAVHYHLLADGGLRHTAGGISLTAVCCTAVRTRLAASSPFCATSRSRRTAIRICFAAGGSFHHAALLHRGL